MTIESIEAFRLPDEIEPKQLSSTHTVVIDVLRATSTITTALANQARLVIPCETIESALATREDLTTDCLLCGERKGARIDGFDRGNSPHEYDLSSTRDRTLVFTTTNGTRALIHARYADHVFLGCFLNLSSVAQNLSTASRVAIVCSGTDRQPTLEDEFFAGALVERLLRIAPDANVSPTAQSVLRGWQQIVDEDGNPKNLAESLKTGQGGINLVKRGYESDIEYCAQIDTIVQVARYDANKNRIELSS